MKIKLVLVAVAILGMIACDDLATVNIDTTVSKDVTVDVEAPSVKNEGLNAYSFYKADTIDISENEDLEEYLDNIKELDIYSATCSLNGIPQGEEISELTISAVDAGLSVTLNNITENNRSINLDVSGSVLKALGEQLLTYEKMLISVSGFSSYAPMTLTVSLDFETTVKAGAL